LLLEKRSARDDQAKRHKVIDKTAEMYNN